MKALRQAEAIQWCRARKLDVEEGPPPGITKDGLDVVRAELPNLAEKHFWFSGFLEGFVRPWHHCLLWVTTHGVGQSSENWHLYYRLRQSYGDLRLIQEAPAHLFAQSEGHDLVSFIQIALGAGWDFYLVTDPDHSRIFVSHDEFVDFFTRGDAELDDLRSDLSKAGIKVLATDDGVRDLAEEGR